MKVLDCSEDFSHYKSMGIFPDAQGQLTLQSTVRSGQISNSYKTLWLSSLRARADNSGVGGGIWPNLNSSKLSCMSPLPARMRMIESKMKALECSQDFSNYKSMGIFRDA